MCNCSMDIPLFLQSEDIESLIPKGLSEFTKQQIRYILQVRWGQEWV